VIRDLLALAFGNACLVAAGHGVLRAVGLRPAYADLPWALGVAYLAGAAVVGVLSSALLVLGLALTWWQIVLLCGAVFAVGLARRGTLRQPVRAGTAGWTRVLPLGTFLALSILAVDLAVQPIWTDDAWSIWAAKANSIAALGGLDPSLLSSAGVFNADYPLLVPVLELVALRFCGIPNELVPLQLGLVFLAFPAALVALLRDRARPVVLWTVALAVSVAPSLQIQAASAVADVPLAVFFALAGVTGWRWVEEGEGAMLGLAASFGAAAVATKVEGGVFVVLLVVGLAVAALRLGRPLRALVATALAIAVSALPWVVWARVHGLGNAYSDGGGAGAVDLAAAVDRVPRAAFAIARELADPSSWLALALLAAGAALLGLRRPGARGAALFTCFVGLASLVALVGVYWTTPLDFEFHIATSARRVVTAPLLFAAAMAPLLLASGRR